jgi:hypothetical protein
MSNSSKKKQFGMNIGSASILLVFVILCLVSFAVLSIVSSSANLHVNRLGEYGLNIKRN